ncbi:MAG: DUF4185 domain-containing protein [Verrucomicrobia bacterium]|nr:DUF4185 domain-containing protein [Verrucomicrobiota bacterium]
MERSTLILLMMFLVSNPCIERGTASADENPLIGDGKRVEPKIKEIQVERLRALTGSDSATEMKPLDVCGTDLGTMTEIGDRIFFAFGDTFGYDGDVCRGVGGPNWRSNVFASTTDHSPENGVVLEDWLRGPDGKAIAVVEGDHQPPFTGVDGEQTKIPTAMVSVGGRIYLHYMSVHGFGAAGGVWDCNYSKFAYSDDLGKTWNQSDLKFGENDSSFNMLALTSEPGRGNEHRAYVYAIGTPCGRFGSARVARVRKEKILNLDAWEYFTGDHGWTANQREATQIIEAPVGEGSILWNPEIGRWMFTYLNEKTASIELREAEYPSGPWSSPHLVASAAQFPQLYGAFLTPSFLKDNGKTLYFIMSMYGPYNTFVMKATIVTYD